MVLGVDKKSKKWKRKSETTTNNTVGFCRTEVSIPLFGSLFEIYKMGMVSWGRWGNAKSKKLERKR